MRKYSGIPALLEQYMEENGADERWVTVRELCDRFGLTRYEYNTILGFLRRLEYGPFRAFPFIVLKIERIERTSPSDPPKRRYLVKRRSAFVPVPGTMDHVRSHVRCTAKSGQSGRAGLDIFLFLPVQMEIYSKVEK